jgi:hypothetical protein
MAVAGAIYIAALDADYLPLGSIAALVTSRLPIMGVAVDAVADLVSVSAQNVAMFAVWICIRRRISVAAGSQSKDAP